MNGLQTVHQLKPCDQDIVYGKLSMFLEDLYHIFTIGFHNDKVAIRCINLADRRGKIRFILKQGEHETKLIKERGSVFKHADNNSFFYFFLLDLSCVPRLV